MTPNLTVTHPPLSPKSTYTYQWAEINSFQLLKKIYKTIQQQTFDFFQYTSRANQDNSPRINRGTGYDNQRAVNVAGARENVAYHKEKMLLCKQEEAGVQLNAEQADWKDDTDDESEEHELEAHYMYMAQLQESMFNDLKKFQAELDKYNDVNYASKVEIDCAKAKGDLMSYKIEFEKSSNAYTRKINDLNQTILDMKKELCAHQETISIMSQAKEAALQNSVLQNLRFSRKLKEAKSRMYDIGVIPNTRVSRPQLKSNHLEDRCVLNDNHDLCVLHYINGVNSRTRQPMVVPVSTREPMHNVNQSVANIHLEYDQNGNQFLSYGDLVLRNVLLIKRVYYVEGLNHNLFSVGQFCDADLEVAFRKSTCYIRDLKGNDLLKGSRGTDLYSITLQDSTTPNLICLMLKQIVSAWFWNRRSISFKLSTHHQHLLSRNICEWPSNAEIRQRSSVFFL
ncbi:hypothetical protein Tco_1329144 [Tanacetum coccineum]